MTHLDDPQRLAMLSGEMTSVSPDACLQNAVEQAARIGVTPSSAISLVMRRIQLFRAHFGLPPELEVTRATSRTGSFCELVVESGGPVVVVDATHDPRVSKELVQAFAIAAYVGVPVRIRGNVVGTLCVIDSVPREFDPDLPVALERIAGEVAEELSRRESMRPSWRRAEGASHAAMLNALLGVAERALSRLAAQRGAAERLTGPVSSEDSRRAAFIILETEDAHTRLRSAVRAMRSELALMPAAPEDKVLLDEKLALADVALTEAEPWIRLSKALLKGYLDAPRAARAARVMRESLRFYETLVEVLSSVAHLRTPESRECA